MTDQDSRLTQLHQIPVFALQDKLIDLIQVQINADEMSERFQEVLNRKPRKLESAIKSLTRDELTRLINSCSEITDPIIQGLFEEYRYGTNPSFYIYVFNSMTPRNLGDLELLKTRFEDEFKEFDTGHDTNMPTTKGLILNDLASIPDQSEIIEGNYRFLQRLDYIDATQNPISTYQTIYGFFWINCTGGYVIIHAQKDKILKDIKVAIENATRISLVSLVITKQLKNSLSFLDPGKMRSSRLYNPDQRSRNFQSISVKDGALYEKDYQKLEDAYPEVSQARYKEIVNGDKETTLVISDKGLLRIFGKFTATQFRRWCLSRLEQIMNIWTTFQDNAKDYISTLNLKQTPELRQLRSKKQKDYLLEIITAFLTLKKLPTHGDYRLSVSPLEIATTFGELVRVQIPFTCKEVSCDEEGYLMCPTCESRYLKIVNANGWRVECVKHRQKRWMTSLPLEGECEQLHLFDLDYSDIENTIEIFLGPKLQEIIKENVQNYFQGYSVDFNQEIIYIRGTNIFYHPNKSQILNRTGDTYINISNSKAVAIGRGATASLNK